MDAELLSIFREELAENLQALASQAMRPTDEWNLIELFRISHSIKGDSRMVGAESFASLAHALEELFGLLRDDVLEVDDALRAQVDRGVGHLVHAVETFDQGISPEANAWSQELRGELQQYMDSHDDASGLSSRPVSTESESVVVSAQSASVTADLATNEPKTKSEDTRIVRLANERLTKLTGIATDLQQTNFLTAAWLNRGESLLDTDATPLQIAQWITDGKNWLRETRTEIDELLYTVQSIRLIAVNTLVPFLQQSLDDACLQAGKEASLEVIGRDVEIDRSMFDRVRTALVHLIRNSIAHGIETVVDRIAAGKSEIGTVTLQAQVVGDMVELWVHDDGAGLNYAAIVAKGQTKGLLPVGSVEDFDRNDVTDLLFNSNFSTATTTTELSGRGVGLDVVRSNIQALRGEVLVDTQIDVGSSFCVRLPLSLVVSRVTVVAVGTNKFGISSGLCDRAISLSRDNVQTVNDQVVVRVGDEDIPLIMLDEMQWSPEDFPQGMILRVRGRSLVLGISEVLDNPELVLQPLPKILAVQGKFSSSAVTDDGSIVLVLDPEYFRGQSAQEATISRQRRALVVDDSVTSRTIVSQIMRDEGFEVVNAEDGEMGLVAAQESVFDIIISDVEMPSMTGFEFCRALRALDSDVRKTPFILVTSLGEGSHIAEGADAGADGYIVKGKFDQAELINNVNKLVGT